MRTAQTVLMTSLLLAPVPASAQRLTTTVIPEHYDLAFVVDLAHARFEGTETIRVNVAEPTARVMLHAVDLEFGEATIGRGAAAQKAVVSSDPGTQIATLTVATALKRGATDIEIRYRGVLNDQLRGFYISKSKTRNYAVTQF